MLDARRKDELPSIPTTDPLTVPVDPLILEKRLLSSCLKSCKVDHIWNMIIIISYHHISIFHSYYSTCLNIFMSFYAL